MKTHIWPPGQSMNSVLNPRNVRNHYFRRNNKPMNCVTLWCTKRMLNHQILWHIEHCLPWENFLFGTYYEGLCIWYISNVSYEIYSTFVWWFRRSHSSTKSPIAGRSGGCLLLYTVKHSVQHAALQGQGSDLLDLRSSRPGGHRYNLYKHGSCPNIRNP